MNSSSLTFITGAIVVENLYLFCNVEIVRAEIADFVGTITNYQELAIRRHSPSFLNLAI